MVDGLASHSITATLIQRSIVLPRSLQGLRMEEKKLLVFPKVPPLLDTSRPRVRRERGWRTRHVTVGEGMPIDILGAQHTFR